MELIRYESAKRAIAEYKTVDEVKDFRDKALAVEAYAKQAKDFELEWDAARARVRAERRCGELLAEMEKAKAGRPPINRSSEATNLDKPKTLSEMGITKDQSSKFQKLAAVPLEEFERAVDNPAAKPTTNHILKTNSEPAEKPARMDQDALWFWGTIRDMRSKNLFDRSINELVSEWTPGMADEAVKLIYQLQAWVACYGKE